MVLLRTGRPKRVSVEPCPPTESTRPTDRPTEIRWRPASLLPVVVIRVVVLLALDRGVAWSVDSGALGDDALGVGLVLMTAWPLVTLLWGAVDGVHHRHRPGLAIAGWLVAAPLAALGMQLVQALDVRAADPTYGGVALWQDLASGTTFMTWLLLVPALLATAGTALVSRGVR